MYSKHMLNTSFFLFRQTSEISLRDTIQMSETEDKVLRCDRLWHLFICLRSVMIDLWRELVEIFLYDF